MKDNPYLADLPPTIQASIETAAVYRSFIPGKTIVIEGKACQTVYLILRGSVNVIQNAPNGKKLVLARLGAGDWFNALSCFNDLEDNPASVLALSPVKVLALTRNDFRRLIETHPVFALKIMDNLSNRLRLLTHKIVNLTLLSTRARVAHFLLEHADENGVIQWRCTQTDVADRLGTVADVVGRVMRKFIDDGLITMPVKNCIVIVDTPGLQQEVF